MSAASTLDAANTLRLDGRIAEAEAAYGAILERDGDCADAWLGMAAVAGRTGRANEAIVHLERAAAIAGLDARIHHNLAGMKTFVGRLAEAETHYREALARDPAYCKAYHGWSISRSFRDDGQPVVAAIEALLKSRSWGPADESRLRFAAGKILDDMNQSDRAWSHFEAGNHVHPADYNQVGAGQFLDSVMRGFDAAAIRALAGAADRGADLLFIVGMPRSGSTLLEQLIAAHPGVHSAGEHTMIPSAFGTLARRFPGRFPEAPRELDPERIREWADVYTRAVAGQAPGKRLHVDKNLMNFSFVGFVRALFPAARVIWIRRDPLDTCLSCYRQRFIDLAYTFDLDDLAFMYARHERIMAHWKRVAGPIVELRYEELARDPEGVGRRIFGVLGLDWRPEFLDFHKATRHIETASKWQARQPVHQDAIGRARAYEAHLGPLRDALSRHGVRY